MAVPPVFCSKYWHTKATLQFIDLFHVSFDDNRTIHCKHVLSRLLSALLNALFTVLTFLKFYFNILRLFKSDD